MSNVQFIDVRPPEVVKYCDGLHRAIRDAYRLPEGYVFASPYGVVLWQRTVWDQTALLRAELVSMAHEYPPTMIIKREEL